MQVYACVLKSQFITTLFPVPLSTDNVTLVNDLFYSLQQHWQGWCKAKVTDDVAKVAC